MKASHSARWEQVRAQGKSRYLLYRGVLPFTLIVTVLLTLLELSTTGGILPSFVVIRLCVFAVVGFFWGNWMWERREKQYLQNNQP